MIDFGRPQQCRVGPDVLPPLEAGMSECDFHEIADRVRDAGGYDVVVSVRLVASLFAHDNAVLKPA